MTSSVNTQALFDKITGEEITLGEIRQFVANGGDINAVQSGYSLLVNSIMFQPEAISIALIQEFHADVAHSCAGSFAVHYAAREDKAATLEALVAAGADVNARDGNLRTPLHIAVLNHNLQSCETLLVNCADFTLTDKFNLSAEALALREGYEDFGKVLKDSIFYATYPPEQMTMNALCTEQGLSELGTFVAHRKDKIMAFFMQGHVSYADKRKFFSMAKGFFPDADKKDMMSMLLQVNFAEKINER